MHPAPSNTLRPRFAEAESSPSASAGLRTGSSDFKYASIARASASGRWKRESASTLPAPPPPHFPAHPGTLRAASGEHTTGFSFYYP